jgi:hypothetical protein
VAFKIPDIEAAQSVGEEGYQQSNEVSVTR